MTTMRHGTYTMYNNHSCRCPECSDAAAEYGRAKRSRKDGWAVQETATRGELREWVAALGFSIGSGLHGKKADALIARYNREHPDRPYLRPSDSGVVSA